MTTTINAVSGTGLTQTSDGSGIVKLQSNGVATNALAWASWNGTLSTPITPRSAYNVGSITKNATGDYTLNFTTALSDANYCITGTAGGGGNNTNPRSIGPSVSNPTTTTVRVTVLDDAGNLNDMIYSSIAIFGN